VIGADTELDRNLVEALADPLVHLVRNAIDHGIESPSASPGKRQTGRGHGAPVGAAGRRPRDHLVRDDGGGIDPEAIRAVPSTRPRRRRSRARMSPDECLQLLFLPGFSTRDAVSDLSGRGVGMDVVQSKIRELSGQVQIHSESAAASLLHPRATDAGDPADLLVEIDDEVYALPLVRVIEVLAHDPATVLRIDGQPMLDLREHRCRC
jgi:two-component system chemotaxis sensor kinase CheA